MTVQICTWSRTTEWADGHGSLRPLLGFASEEGRALTRHRHKTQALGVVDTTKQTRTAQLCLHTATNAL